MLELKQVFPILIAIIFQSGYSISSFPTSQLFVAEAFTNMGMESRIHSRHSSDQVISASSNVDLERSNQIGSIVLGQPPYKIAGVDLSASWIDLVRQKKVSASINLPSAKGNAGDSNDGANDGNCQVEYGIRLAEKNNENTDGTRFVFEEYVQQLGDHDIPNPLISNINATLTRSQQQSTDSGVDSKQVGNFVAQLQLVRTLRPPPSKGFQEATTSDPPPYDPETDSFVTGPLRLDLRPLVGRLKLSTKVDESNDEGENESLLTTSWDVFHNVSPADRRGHFLLLPSLLNKERNWRGQYFTKDDCHDLVHLTSSIEPAGSMFIGYNSVGAGASQNHIHCHSWPYPRISAPKIESEKGAPGQVADNFCYAVNNVDAIYDFCDIHDGKVEVSYLNYPVFCIQMSSSVVNLDLLGGALATCLEAIGEAPHNIGFLNRIHRTEEDEDDDKNEEDNVEDTIEKMVDVFIFARSKERSSILPTLKLGISEMMGIFHAQSEAELDVLTAITGEVFDDEEGSFKSICAMEEALAEVSSDKEEELWNDIVARLVDLENKN